MDATRKRSLTGSLRTRVLILAVLSFAAISIPAYFSFVWIVNSTVVTLGTLFAEKQILFDRYRGLGALMQEVKLAETLAHSDAIVEWAKDETNRERQARGIAELEHYRAAFSDHSYFFAIAASGNYYFNDAADAYAGKQLSHTLHRGNPRDGWFYETLELGHGCHLNVDNDDALRVTKVWFNCVVTDGKQALGVLGSGLDLTSFIREVVDIPQTGVQAMFVDHSGALQAHRDPRFIDFHSLTKDQAEKKTIFSLLDRPADRESLRAMMAEVTSGEVKVRSRFMQVGGQEMLVGVGYLDQLGWYNVTLMDVDKIIDRSLFLPIGLLLAAIMIVCALLVVFLFKRSVLDRLQRVESRMRAVRDGDPAPIPAATSNDEIGRLEETFSSMATSVQDNTKMLEMMVAERTEELRRLAYRDQLTDIPNRRGFIDTFAQLQGQPIEPGERRAVMLIDIDNFKSINDQFGHLAGDRAVVETARRLTGVLRPMDLCGRWGGDEFIVLVNGLETLGLRAIAQAVKKAVTGAPIRLPDGREISLTVSLGGALVEPEDTIDTIVDMADAALYSAKAQGRDRVVIFDPVRNDVDQRRA
ncbi:MAG TPA: diguanylate cyclase [Devosia sp.]